MTYFECKRLVACALFTTLRMGMTCRRKIMAEKSRDLAVKMYPNNMLEFARIRAFAKGRSNNEDLFLDRFLKSCLDASNVLDIGAHIGTFSLFAAKAVGAKGKIWAFEMDALNFASLQNNVRRNRLNNVHALNKAVSSRAGKVHYRRPSKRSGEGGIIISDEKNADYTVATVTIDSLVTDGEIPCPDVVKVDVEGHELEVLRGMTETLRQHPVQLFIEVHDRLLVERGQSAQEVDLFVKDLGYSCSENLSTGTRAEKHILYEKI